MKIDKQLIEKVAKNARLKLTDKEIKEFIPQFKEILDTLSKLKEVNTENTKVSIQPVEIKNITRKDEIGKCFTTEEILSNTKHKKNNYFLGPKAL